MPIQVSFENLRRRLALLEDYAACPDPLLMALAEKLVAHLEANTPVGATGILKRAMTQIRGPYDVPGGRAIGVGNMEMLIDPSISAPPFTIRSFLIWYAKQYEAQKKQRRREERARALPAVARRKALSPTLVRSLIRKRMDSIWERIQRMEAETPFARRTPEWHARIRRLEQAWTNLERKAEKVR